MIVGKGRDSRGKRGSLRGGNDGMLHKLKIDVVFFSRYFLFLGLRSASLHGPIVEVMDSGTPCRRMKGQQSLPFVKRSRSTDMKKKISERPQQCAPVTQTVVNLLGLAIIP